MIGDVFSHVITVFFHSNLPDFQRFNRITDNHSIHFTGLPKITIFFVPDSPYYPFTGFVEYYVVYWVLAIIVDIVVLA